jgi:arabinofuranosyltransferase
MKDSLIKVASTVVATIRYPFIVAPDLGSEKIKKSNSVTNESMEQSFPVWKNGWLAILIVVLTLLAIKNAFVQDDAFISFRYADNLAQHGNFSWNANDTAKLEGYTNFLWTIIISACIKSGFDPVQSSMIIGILFGIGTLIATYRVGLIVLGDFRYAMLTVLLLGTNYTFSGYMTGGLETQMQTFLLTMVAFFSFKSMQKREAIVPDLLLLSFFSALAILTRLDSILIIGLLILPMLYFRMNHMTENKTEQTFVSVLWITLPVFLIVFPWLYWKYQYYGDLLPNSFYLKGQVLSFEVIKNGIYYLFTFLSSYYLIVFVVLFALQIRKALQNKFITMVLIVLAGWFAYILKVGGDFMEFRFFVPVLPSIMLIVAWVISGLKSKTFRYIGVIILLLGSISHQVMFINFHGTDSIKKLHGMIYNPETNWRGIGLRLNELFHGVRDKVVIGTTAAGAIPYYSKLNTIDMFGVNDRWIAVNGDMTKHFKPGHQRIGRLDYYLKSNVDLIIGHPEVRSSRWSEGRESIALIDFDNFRISSLDKRELPAATKIIEIPIDNDFSVFALYLRSRPEIDDIIAKNHIKTFAID